MKDWLLWFWRLIWQPRKDARLMQVKSGVEEARYEVDELRDFVMTLGGKIDGS